MVVTCSSKDQSHHPVLCARDAFTPIYLTDFSTVTSEMDAKYCSKCYSLCFVRLPQLTRGVSLYSMPGKGTIEEKGSRAITSESPKHLHFGTCDPSFEAGRIASRDPYPHAYASSYTTSQSARITSGSLPPGRNLRNRIYRAAIGGPGGVPWKSSEKENLPARHRGSRGCPLEVI